MWNRNEQTICAISTPHGVGGIAVIRVSGKQALQTVKKLAPKLNNKKIESHRVYFTDLIDQSGNKIDEAVITFFAEGKSFTGEEVVEISCHGSRFIAQQILDLLVREGCRMADRGEFTFRAFMNGRLDLIQAESVLGLVESQNQASAKVALRQLEGHVSKQLDALISDLVWCLAHIEASIDFSEQGIEVVDAKVLINKLQDINSLLQKLQSSYQSGRLIKDGVKVALIGEPNVGKSSLLNLLVQQDRAIVTPIAGTTRDAIESETLFQGVKFSISDTAGLRETQDQVEIIGIDKSKKEAEKSDVLCFVMDCSEADWSRSLELAEQQKHQKKIFVLNKSDKISYELRESLLKRVGGSNEVIFTSANDPLSRDLILSTIKKAIGSLEFLNETIISSSRQYEQICYAEEMISKSLQDLTQNTGSEFVAMYLKEALLSLQKIVGQVYDDQILDRVFKEFCLGK